MEVMKDDRIEKAKAWYGDNRLKYEALCLKMESVVRDIISDSKIPVHAIYNRTKSIDSFVKKISADKYDDPINQITDLSGLRIITYVENDLDKICNLIKEHFLIDDSKSIDKRQSLGIDKVGYRSIHFIVKLSEDRLKIPEFKKFNGLCFEIQIRTIIQHAWAEIEHDKNYKFTGVLPEHLKRRFNVLAGVLELADREFNEIANEIDKHSQAVIENTTKGKLDIPIDSTSIKSYLNVTFQDLSQLNFNFDFGAEMFERAVLHELYDFGIKTLQELDNIIPADYISKFISHNKRNSNFYYNLSGLLRQLMIIENAENYFKNAWKRGWRGMRRGDIAFYALFNLDIEQYLQRYDIVVSDN